MRHSLRFSGLLGALLASLYACSSDDPESPSGAGGGVSCDGYLDCVAAADPSNLAAAIAAYGEQGTCWTDLAPPTCEQACVDAQGELYALHPEVVECMPSGAGGSTAVCSEPTEVPCSDQVILDMNLKADPAPGLIDNEADGAGWNTHVDAVAGGAFATNPDAYVYGRFTATGLEKVDISDEDALESMEWDIAFRRYVIRINSGHSGPSCVTGARVVGVDDYDSLAEVPDGLTFLRDEYFTESCELIPDGSGLPGSPATVLSTFWTYPGCVQMTYHLYVLELQDGRHVKLVITHYYEEPYQQECQDTDAVSSDTNGSANIRFRWAFLP